ncbi:MAG: hypothetical protein R3C05_05705 [Pirellulaceae bacterium]
MPNRFADRLLRFVALLMLAWWVMTLSHEVGHLIGGWLGGAKLVRVELRPWHLPYSLFQPDPHPLLTLWAGPLFGVAFPVTMALIVKARWLWFVASFCSVANGSYLATAWISGDAHLDTSRLLQAGAWPAGIAVYCCLTIGWGYLRFRRACIELLRGDEHHACHNDI